MRKVELFGYALLSAKKLVLEIIIEFRTLSRLMITQVLANTFILVLSSEQLVKFT